MSQEFRSTYLGEVLTPQIVPKFQTSQKSLGDRDMNDDGEVDSFEKNVRQFIYDVRHLMKKNNIPVERAFQIRSANTKYGSGVIKAAKEKLGIKIASASTVDEENLSEYNTTKLYTVVINYKNGTTSRERKSHEQISRLRTNPNVSSVEKTEYAPNLKKAFKSRLDPVGREDGDVNNDGVEDKTDDYLLNRRSAIGKAIKKREVREGFSNWRQELFEVIDDEIESKEQNQVKEKKVTNKVTIGPSIDETVRKLGGSLISTKDITEKFLSKKIKNASNYFYEHNLNEYGVKILIDKLGIDEFYNFIDDISHGHTLMEWRETSSLNERDRRVALKVAEVKQPELNLSSKEIKEGIIGFISSINLQEELDLHEVSPPGFKGTVKAMKRHPKINNPFALARYMEKKGYTSHRKASGAMKEAVVPPNPVTDMQNSTQSRQQKTQRSNIQAKFLAQKVNADKAALDAARKGIPVNS